MRFWHACVDLRGTAMVTNDDMLAPLTEHPGNRESVSQYSEEGTYGYTKNTKSPNPQVHKLALLGYTVLPRFLCWLCIGINS